MSNVSAQLIGAADPAGYGLGFLVPAFMQPQINAVMVQRIDTNGLVIGFDALDPPDVAVLPLASKTLTVGDAPLWIMGFGGEDLLVGQDDGDQTLLCRRLDDPLFRDRPMLGMEVATFLGSERRFEFAAIAYARLLAISQIGAARWRDLTLLTPELRARLKTQLETQYTQALNRLVAVTRETDVIIYGDRLPPPVEGLIREELKSLLRDLAPLYPTALAHSPVRFRWSKAQVQPLQGGLLFDPTAPASLVAAAQSWASPRVVVQQPVRPDPLIDRSSLPWFLVEQNATSPVATEEMTKGVSARILLTRGRRPIAPSLPLEQSALPTLMVSTPGLSASNIDEWRLARALHQGVALAIELERKGWLIERRQAVLMTVKLRRRNLLAGWANLYDDIWAAGLDPRHSFLAEAYLNAPPEEAAAQPLKAILFDRIPIHRSGLLDDVFRMGGPQAIVVAPLTHRRPEDIANHRQAVSRVLAAQGWAVDDVDPARLDGPLRIKGTHLETIISMEPAGKQGGRRQPLVALAHLKGLRLTCSTSYRQIVEHLGSGELALNVEDLIQLDGKIATFYSILGAQLYRLRSQKTNAHSLFIAWLLREADQNRQSDADGQGAMIEAAATIDDTSQVRFVARAIRRRSGRVTAQITLEAKDGNAFAAGGTALAGPIRLTLSDRGIKLG
ncbi:MAG: hypothetical protein V4618_15635 [Pseudomonadota bacterium]